MKKNLILPLRLLLIAVLIAAVALTFASCGNGVGTETKETAAKTETAAATESGAGTESGTATESGTEAETEPVEIEKIEVGSGAKTVTVKVVKDKSVTEITLHTDKDNLADALLEHELVEGSESEYGLFITSVNGVAAEENYFWSLEQNGEMLMTGASTTPVSDGEGFEFVYTKIEY
ncbi:MAG: DUF4430 domain-containing protein [Clostridia bacterium]|nr:DUF4430 domain-containing protein [Clostridia bacterium]